MTTESKGYNGWTNYETWLLALNIDNEEALNQDVENLIERLQYKRDTEACDTFKEYLEDLFYNEEFNVYKICDTWTVRDWNKINFYEIFMSKKKDLQE